MAELSTVMQALRNADAAGDTVAATRIAQIARQMSTPQTTPVEEVKPDFSVGQLASRGFERGKERLKSTFTDLIPAMVGGALGFDDYAQAQLTEAADKEAALQARIPAQYATRKDVHGVGDAVKYGIETIAEQIPNLFEAVATGLGGGAVAKRVLMSTVGKSLLEKAAKQGLVGEARDQFVMQGLRTAGQTGGVFLGSYALNAPEVFQNVYQETGEIEPAVSLIYGAAAAALDSVFPTTITRNISGPLKAGIVENLLTKSGMNPGALRGMATGLAKGLGTEGLTEGAQEAISIAAERFVSENPDVFGSDEWERIIESSVRGAVAGGGFGIAGGAVEGVRERGAEKRRVAAENAAETKRLADLEEAKRLRTIVDEGFDEETNKWAVALTKVEEEVAAAENAKTVAAAEAWLAGKQPNAVEEQPTPKIAKRTASKKDTGISVIEREASTPAVVEPILIPTTEAELKVWAKERGFNSGLNIFKEDGPLADLARGEITPEQAAEVLIARGQKYSGKNRAALDALLASPIFQNTAPTTTPAVVDETDGLQEYRDLAQQDFASGSADQVFDAQEEEYRKLDDEGADAYRAEIERLRGAATSTEAGGGTTVASTKGEPNLGFQTNAQQDKKTKAAKKLAKEIAAENSRNVVNDTDVLVGMEANDADVKISLYKTIDGKFKTVPKNKQGESLAPVVHDTAADAVARIRRYETKDTDPNFKRLRSLYPTAAGTNNATARTDPYALTREQADEQAEMQAELEKIEKESVPVYVASIYKDIMDGLFANIEYYEDKVANVPKEDQLTKEGMLEILRDPERFVNGVAWRMGLRGEEGMAYAAELVKKLNGAVTDLDSQAAARIMGRMRYVRKTLPMVAAQLRAQLLDIPGVTKEAADTALKGTDEQVDALIAQLTATYTNAVATLETSFRNIRRPGKLFGPVYKGKNLDASALSLVKSGELRRLTKSLADSATPAVRKVLNKVYGLNLSTKVVVGSLADVGSAGSYDPNKDTITLDPDTGLNEHTVIHELIHAAVSKVLRDPSNKLTQDFTAFFDQIKGRMGSAYGGQNLQEFASELVSNPEFQALLKTIKAPKSESLFTSILRAIAKFFGVGGVGRTSFDEGMRFINDVMDIAGGVAPSGGDVLFYGPGSVNSTIGSAINMAPQLVEQVVEKTKNEFSNIKNSKALRLAFSLLRLDNINKMYGKEIPALQKLIDAVQLRQGEEDKRIKHSNNITKTMQATLRKYPEQSKELGGIANELRLEELDILTSDFTLAPQSALKLNPGKETLLYNRFKALPADVQQIYFDGRREFDNAFNEFVALLASLNPDVTKQTLKQQLMAAVPVTAYVPFLRYGDYVVAYEENGKRAERAFESDREREQWIAAQPKDVQDNAVRHSNLSAIEYRSENVPPTGFIGKTIAAIKLKAQQPLPGETEPQRKARLDSVDEQVKEVYQLYLQTFPGNSIMQHMQKSDNVLGMSDDIVRGFSSLMTRWARKLPNARYLPDIQKALEGVANTGKFAQDRFVRAAAETIVSQAPFIKNPTYGWVTRKLTTASFGLYIAGNISSALINLTSIGLLTLPLLGARFGYNDTFSVLANAGKTAMKGIGADGTWGEGRYKNLYDAMVENGLLQHTMATEILQGASAPSAEMNSPWSRLNRFISIPFSETEKYNRAVTAIAAYELALKGNTALGVKERGETEAIKYALDTVKDANTSGMAATGPKVMQNDIGRVVLTFKSFIWNSAFIVANSMYRGIWKSTDPNFRKAEKKIAIREVIGLFGMSGAVAGVGGMPFFGAGTLVAEMFMALTGLDDDDDPVDVRDAARQYFGELAYKGPLNYFTNTEIANRASLANGLLFRDDPQGIAQDGYVATAMKQSWGPLGSYVFGLERGLAAMRQGEIERGAEAFMPSWIRNGMKSMRYAMEGATTLDGQPIDEDINAWNVLMQVVGFAPADLSSTYEKRNSMAQRQNIVLARKAKLLDLLDMARQSGDVELLADTRKAIADFGRKWPGLIQKDTMSRSYKARRAAERDAIKGMRFNTYLAGPLEKRFFQD